MDKPYVIVSPDYDYTSGGIKVMWALYGWLLARGKRVYMNRRPDGDVIGIYPEIQVGNPAQTDKVVRYVLNKPGVMGGYQNGVFVPGPSMFDESEKVYYFSRMFGTTNAAHYLFLPAIDLHVFKDLQLERDKTCFLVGKGIDKHNHPDDSIGLNRDIAKNQSALAKILNECHTFYCYDNLTAMMEIARLCGCRVEYHGNHTMKELENYEPGLNGINSELDTIAFRRHYIAMIREFETKLEDFIDETQQW